MYLSLVSVGFVLSGNSYIVQVMVVLSRQALATRSVPSPLTVP